MNRRKFLKSSTVALAATAATGPIILGAEKRVDPAHPIVGEGAYQYECHHNWGTLPAELEWQTTHNVAIDSEGLIYITHQGHAGMKGLDCVIVLDSKGKFVRSFGKEWHGGGHGIEIRKEGGEEFIYLTNTWTPKLKIVKTNLKGETVWQKGRPEIKEYENPKTAYNPTNVAFTPDGGFIVGDGYGSNYLMIYDKDAKLTSTFGGSGKAEGQFQTPHGQWVDLRNKEKPTIVVCDRANARLQTFSLDGQFQSMTEKGVVLFPANIDIQGDVMMVTDLHARIGLFGKDGKLIVNLGDDAAWRTEVLKMKIRAEPKEWANGKFVHPHDAAFDKDGNILLVEWVNGGRISMLKKVV